ncbi:metallophosphoesterase family protein [Virgibacillus sp. W0430]|uniref:metallophosphoesterase family protein n=1 Tax=Virgibacillus sp. W0430 TaxID=3391580 RepID=UPI003F47AB5E
MKIAFISDIHGNAAALEAVLNNIEKNRADQIVVLGDICFRGVEPRRSIKLIQSLNTHVIKGNADEWVVRGMKANEVPEQDLTQMTEELKWATSKLDAEDIDYLYGLPQNVNLELKGFKINAFHATPSSLFDIVLPDATDEVLREALMKSNAHMYVYGHIHKAYVRYIDGKCVVNPGSVGLPLDGTDKASYALVEIKDGSITVAINKVAYDVQCVIKQIRNSNYPNKKLLIQLLGNN